MKNLPDTPLYFCFFLGLLGLAVLASIWYSPVMGNYNFLRFVLAFILTFAVGPLLWQQSKHTSRYTGIWLALLWAGLLLPATLLNPHSAAWLEPFQYAVYVIIFVAAGHFLAQKNHLAQATLALVSALVVVMAVYSFYSLLTYIFIIADGKKNFYEFLPWGFINIRYWSQVASWCLPILPLALLSLPLKRHLGWRCAVYASFAIWVWILMLSTARGSGLALICSSLLMLVVFRSRSKEWLVIIAKGTALGVVLWLLLSVVLPSFIFDEAQLRNFSTTSSGRFPLWREAFAMSWQNFPLGMGPFSWVSHEPITAAYQSSLLYGHPHFMLLFWAAEYGWLAILPLFALALYAGKVVAQVRQTASIEFVAITASVIAALIHSCFSAVFITPYSMLVGLVVLSVFWGYIQQQNPVLHTASNQLSSWFFKLLALALSVLGVLWFIYIFNYHQQLTAELENPEISIIGEMSPRFWSNSHINAAETP